MANRRKAPSRPPVFKVIRPPKPQARPMTKAQQLQQQRASWFLSGRVTEEEAAPSFTNTYSVLLDGVDEHVSVPDSADWHFTTKMSFACWAKETGSLQIDDVLASRDGSGDNCFLIRKNGGDSSKFQAFIAPSGASYARHNSSDATSIVADTWYHVVMVYDGDQAANDDRVQWYVNGASAGGTSTGTIPTSLRDSSLALLIGERGPGAPFGGNLDEVLFYNTALSASDVTDLYNSGAAVDPETLSSSAGIVSFWRMGDGDTHPTATDTVGSNDGTYTNTEAGDIEEDVGTT